MIKTRQLLMASAASLMLAGAAFAQVSDDTLVVGLSADITTFEPAAVSSRDNANIVRHIFNTLQAIEADGSVVPELATDLAVSDDGLTYTYTLKDGVTCSDGEPLNAEDVAYSFNRAADPANAFTGNTPGFVFTSIGFAGAEVVDPLHVAIKISAPNKIAFGLIAEVYVHCMDSYKAMTLEQAAATPIGSGPYKLASWTPGSEVVLEKVGEPANFQKIVYRIIPEASTRSAELMAGNVDIITNVAPDQIDAINASGTAAVQAVQGTRRMYLGFNLAPEFAAMPGGDAIQKPDVRRALQYAVDVPTICKQLLNFECERATGLVNPPNANPNLKPYPYDPAKAEALLDAAGYPRKADGTRFEIRLQAGRGRYLNDENVVLALAQYLTDVGVKVDLDIMEWGSVYVPLIRERNVGPLFFLGSGGGNWSPLYDMTDLAEVDSGTNYTHWNDPRWFSRWADIAAAKTPEEVTTIVNEMLQVFYDDGPWLLLYFQPDFYGVSNRINWTARPDEEVLLFNAALK
jgi:peptide/nickel transport system substrate-binding protein